MSGNDFAKHFQVPTPCTEDWDSMIGNDRIRFCSHCQKSVHNLSEVSAKQINRLIAKSEGRLCVRYKQIVPKPLPTPVPTLYKIGRRTSVIASAFSASLSLSSAMAATVILKQSISGTPVASSTFLNRTVVGNGSGSIEGVIFDPKGSAIRGATVTLINADSNETFTTYADSNGHYEFKNLQPGTYNLKAQADGFALSDLPSIPLRANENNRIDQTLSISSITETVEIVARESVIMGGAMIVSPEDPLVRAAFTDEIGALREALLRNDANTRDKRTEATALEYAVQGGNREMVQLLLWAKADVNARNREGQTVLMMFAENATSELAWDLLHAGAKVNARDKDGDTPLSESAAVNNTEILKTLLDAGAKVNTTNNEGESPLMRAAAAGLVNNIRLLIQGGADINARDKKGRTALSLAKEGDHRAAVRLLTLLGAIEFDESSNK